MDEIEGESNQTKKPESEKKAPLYRRRSVLLSTLGIGIGAPAGVGFLGCRVFSAPRYTGPKSDHFDGKVFHNQLRFADRDFGDFLRWRFERPSGKWGGFQDRPPGAAPPRHVDGGRMRVTFINHATTLIQMDGINVLTDPIYSERCGPVSWAGPKRIVPPGIRYRDLPPIDAVLISHNHYDHLDVPTLERLASDHRPKFVTALGNSALLEEKGIRGGIDLDWWDEAELSAGVKATAVPAQHWSSRGFCDRAANLWCGFVVQGAAGAAYFAGDTGAGPQFAQLRERFGAPRLAIVPIGAYLPQWFMQPVHLSPKEALEAHRELGAKVSLGVHYGTFELADDGPEEPIADLNRAREELKISEEEFWVLEFGEGRDVPEMA